jgi:hypothetical protein
MTDELFRAAKSRGSDSEDAAFVPWVPFFDDKTGVIDGLAKPDTKGSVIEKRYAPWSPYLKRDVGHPLLLGGTATTCLIC